MDNPEFTQISKGFGIPAEKIEKREELAAAMKRMLDSKESYLLEIMVEKEDNVFPMVPTGSCVSKVRLK